MLTAKSLPEFSGPALPIAGISSLCPLLPFEIRAAGKEDGGNGDDRGDDGGDDRGGGKGGGGSGQDQVGLATRTRTKPKKPSMFKVLMLNDDYTPMEFVVICLKRFFNMDMEQATRVMLHVHQKGVGVCGVFPYEIAETKVNQVMDLARQNQHPLQCTLEKA
jgi:ATP-dependent Clp protease adaptor protein ClpS